MDGSMDILNRQQHIKPFREWLLSLCGYEIWPPTYSNPFIKGPQPRIITKRQVDAMRAMAEANRDEAIHNFDHQGKYVL
jgi:hypothetical protein